MINWISAVKENKALYAEVSLLLFVLRNPRTILRLSDKLEGLTELRKAVIFIFMVYYSESIQIKFSKAKRHIEWTPGETQAQASRCLSHGVI